MWTSPTLTQHALRTRILLDINRRIHGSSSYRTLSFIDVYSGYKHIRKDPLDTSKTEFMSNIGNNYYYYYNSMPFILKNVSATCQRLMDGEFSNQIGPNLEVYINDMIVKPIKGQTHEVDLENVLQSIRKYNMPLNPTKCSFWVARREVP